MALTPEHARRLVRRSGPVLLAGLLWFPACGSTSTTSTGTSTTAASAPATSGTAGGTGTTGSTGATPGTSTTELAPPGTVSGADLTPKQGEGSDADPVAVTHLTAVRLARQDGYDRVVFEFDGGVPAYQVSYVDGPIIEDPSGRTIPVEGAGLLRVRFDRASGVALDQPGGPVTYTGPNRVKSDAAAVQEVVSVGDFEAVMTWVVGIDSRRPNKVSTLTSPSRVIIDIATA